VERVVVLLDRHPAVDPAVVVQTSVILGLQHVVERFGHGSSSVGLR
jgi:hypothetical protein